MIKRIFRSPITSVVLFLVGAGLLLSSSIGGTLAVLNIQSDDYLAHIELDEIDVGLTENTIDIPNGGELLLHLVPEGEEFQLGKTYDEVLAVKNTAQTTENRRGITEYVRVSVYKYWLKNGQKDINLDPSLIELSFVTGEGWSIDEDASTPERTVLYYYTEPIDPGQVTTPFTDTLTVSAAADTPEYEDASCHIYVVVDGVQNHNAGPAITSAWGHNFLGLE